MANVSEYKPTMPGLELDYFDAGKIKTLERRSKTFPFDLKNYEDIDPIVNCDTILIDSTLMHPCYIDMDE
jgi:hypothetical protein